MLSGYRRWLADQQVSGAANGSLYIGNDDKCPRWRQ
jgi:hypothetical protein